MLKEAVVSRRQVMETHYQALIDAALQHERVIEFLAKLYRLLGELERTDVEVHKESWLSYKGVIVSVSIRYDALYPGEAAEDPVKNARMKQAEVVLLNSLREEGVNVENCFGEGRGGKMKINYNVFRVMVNYQGEILPTSPI